MRCRVEHIIWGEGDVEYRDARYIRITFDDADIGTRTFVWPDAFERFLRFKDAERQSEVEALLREAERQRAECKAAEQKRLDESKRARSDAQDEKALKRKRALAYAHARNKKLMH